MKTAKWKCLMKCQMKILNENGQSKCLMKMLNDNIQLKVWWKCLIKCLIICLMKMREEMKIKINKGWRKYLKKCLMKMFDENF